MSDGPVHAEKLHLAQLPTQPLQEPETPVHILARVGQQGTDHQNPAIDRRRNEQFPVADPRHSVRPGAGRWIVQAQRRLHRLRVGAPDGHPAVGAMKDRRMEKSAAAHLSLGGPARAAAKPHGAARSRITSNDDNQDRSDQQHGSQKQ